MMRLLASTALVIVLCCALCDFAVTLISVTVKTPAQGRVAQRACFRISQSLLTLDRLGPTQVFDAAVFTSQALSAITSGSVTTTIFLSLSYILSVASRRKHGSPEAKKLAEFPYREHDVVVRSVPLRRGCARPVLDERLDRLLRGLGFAEPIGVLRVRRFELEAHCKRVDRVARFFEVIFWKVQSGFDRRRNTGFVV